MVQFDQAFIPAWYYAYKGDLDGAQKAMIPLTRKWQQFKKRYSDPIYGKGVWKVRYLYEIDDYYLDAVWNLETTIAVAVATAEDRKLKLLEWEMFVELSEEVDHAWQALLREPFDPDAFGLNDAEILLHARSKNDLNKAIKNYLKAVETADGDLFEIAAKNMEPAYVNFITTLGDFDDLRVFIAAN